LGQNFGPSIKNDKSGDLSDTPKSFSSVSKIPNKIPILSFPINQI
jgi:hypothetical protein